MRTSAANVRHWNQARLTWNLTTRRLADSGTGSVGECGRLSQSSWLSGAL